MLVHFRVLILICCQALFVYPMASRLPLQIVQCNNFLISDIDQYNLAGSGLLSVDTMLCVIAYRCLETIAKKQRWFRHDTLASTQSHQPKDTDTQS